MKTVIQKMNPRSLMVASFLLTLPSLIFWCIVSYTRLFHDPQYVDAILASGGTFCDVFLKGAFPFMSLLVAFICHRILREQAIAHNVWHRDTRMMRVNQGLINWNAFLLLVMIFSLINN